MISSRFNNYGVHLVENEDDLNTMMSSFSTKINLGIDTETTGLDYNDDQIVGICISGGQSYKDYHGYYIPVRHINYNNIPLDKALQVTQKCLDNFNTFFFNRSFDFTMFEKEGIDVSKAKSFDTQVMAHLALNISFPALKQITKQILGFDVLTFDSVSKTHNFGHTDPRVSYPYGASDPVITVLLGRELWYRFPYIRKIFPLDNKVGEALRYITTRTELPLDKDVLEVELDKVNKEISELQNKIFTFVGYRFRLTSNRDKAEALSRFITLTEKTNGGQYSVKEDVLKDLNHPLADMFIKQAQLEKYRSSYLQKMFDFPNNIRINYSSVNVATGRLSSGSSKGNNYFVNLNIQNIPKEEVYKYLYPHPSLGVFALSKDYIPFPKDYFEVEEPLTTETCLNINGTSYPKDVLIPSLSKLISELEEGDILPSGEVIHTIIKKRELCGRPKESITVWGEQVVVTSSKQVKTKGGLREAFIPPKGYVHLSGDYASEEMRLIGNFSKEPHYLEPIKNGLDIHSYIAEKMFGYSDKSHRTKVKILNFSVNYGAGPQTIAKNIGISIEEATELLDNYNKTLSNLTRWKEETMKQARRTGMSYTLFGRPRLLYGYYNSSNYSDRSFADRTAVNNPVQGAVTKDTKILTNSGYIRFSEIIKGLTRLDSTERHKTLKVSNGKSFVDFSVFAQGVTTVKRVSLKNGLNVKASEQHLFKVLTDEGIVDVWRDNLKVGDKVVCILPQELDTPNEDNKDTPRFLIDKFIEAYNKYGLSKSTFLGNKKLENRNRSLLSKMRSNKSVGINTFNSMCKDYGFTELTSYFTYSEVKSIESCEDEETFCICMEDAAHQYVANGMVHHNCTPTAGYLELENQVIQMDKFLGQRLNYDSSVLIPTHRGASKPLLCVFNTNDFIVCDSNHSLVTGNLKQPKESKLSNFFSFKGRRQKVLLSNKPFPKIAINSYLFNSDKAISYIKLNCKKDVLDNKDKYMKASFLCLALTRKWFSYDFSFLSKIRSLASIYGYNSLYSEKKDKLRISFHRHKKAKIKAIYQLSEQDVEMGTCTSVYGYQIYRNQGFWNKNTGGDIIRLGLCKIYDLMLNNKEFRDNVQFASTVHDEFNFFVKPHYLHTAYKIIKELMYFNIPQFEVPIVADISIGTNWGNLVDVADVTEDNKIVVKE